MYKFAIIASLAASLALPAARAGQGAFATVSVYSSSTGVSAYGSIADARISADNVQYIGCGILTNEDGSSIIQCYASDTAGNGAYCDASDPSQAALAAVSSVNGVSAVYFTADSSGHCTYLSVSNASYYFISRIP
jgi:hypothetical protein